MGMSWSHDVQKHKEKVFLCSMLSWSGAHLLRRRGGVTYGMPTWIWSIVVDGNLYVRADNGTNSSCYQTATKQKAGRITVEA